MEWIPIVTFAEPGDMIMTYKARKASYVAVARLVTITFNVWGPITHSTASGPLRLSGLPFLPTAPAQGTLQFNDFVKPGYTQFVMAANIDTPFLDIDACGCGMDIANVVAADVPSGGTLILRSTITYERDHAIDQS